MLFPAPSKPQQGGSIMVGRRHVLRAAAASPLLAVPHVAEGQTAELVIGLGSVVSSLDPLFYNNGPNINVALNIFESLVSQDERQRLQPGLATKWRAVDDTTWEFTLRRGVVFHDGSPFGAEDVAASIRRAAWVPNSIGPFTVYTRAITETVIVNDGLIQFKTATPYPLLPTDLSMINIIPRRYEQAPTADFNSGRATVGTGRFRLVGYTPDDRIVLQRNEGYWGEKPHWDRATLRLIPNGATRLAALLAGDVHATDILAPTDTAGLRANPNVAVARTLSNSVLFLHLDSSRDQTPFATDKAGTVLPANPFKDVRVRQAISKAINRRALVERVMEGAAAPAGFLLADGFFGVSPKLTPDEYDPDAARQLLAEAGYPDGFGLTIHGPRDRFLSDEKVLQAVGPMLVRIGIETRVVVQPWAVYASQASVPNYAYSAMLFANYATTGEASFPLRAQVATVSPERGMGAQNRARYSNSRLDELLARALETIDDSRREALLFEAGEAAMGDQAIVPLFYPDNLFALRRNLRFAARSDGYMAAHMIRPAD
jgi:peptide/nickel transport system substrate-binding protein